MKAYSFSHLADRTLVREFVAAVTQNRGSTATLLAYLAEVDHRRLYLPAAHASMYSYCVNELHMSEETAFRRIRVARIARQYPAIFPALAEGRLNLTAVLLLAPHLTPDNADELLAAATHKRKSEIVLLLAERFPKPDVPTLVQAVDGPGSEVDLSTGSNVSDSMGPLAPEPVVPSDEPKTAESMGPLSECVAPRAASWKWTHAPGHFRPIRWDNWLWSQWPH